MSETTAKVAHEQIGYTVRNFIDAAELKADIAFSTADLNTAMMKQSALFVHYGVQFAEASHQVDVVKMLLESTEATYYKLIRDQFIDSGDKFTETLLDKLVSRSAKVISLKKALTSAKRIESMCKTATEGFRHRRDMLIQQGMLSREEMKGDLHIAVRNAKDDAVEAQKESVLTRIRSKE